MPKHPSTHNTTHRHQSTKTPPLPKKNSRPHRIERSNSFPLKNNKNRTASRALESFFQSNDLVAIPARKRSVSNHSGDGTYEDMMDEVKKNEERHRTKKKQAHHPPKHSNNNNKNNNGVTMERFLNSAVQGGEVDIEDTDEDALRHIAPAGVILVNTADPRTALYNNNNNNNKRSHPPNNANIPNYDPKDIPKDHSQTQNNLDNHDDSQVMLSDMDMLLLQSKSHDTGSLSDGSLFEDTIGLDKIGSCNLSLSDSDCASSQPSQIQLQSPQQKQQQHQKSKQVNFSKLENRTRHFHNLSSPKQHKKKKYGSESTLPNVVVNIDGFDYDESDHYDKKAHKKKNRKRNPYHYTNKHKYPRAPDEEEGAAPSSSSYQGYGTTAFHHHRPFKPRNKSPSTIHPLLDHHTHHIPLEVTVSNNKSHDGIHGRTTTTTTSHDKPATTTPASPKAKHRRQHHRRATSIMDSVFSSARSTSTEDMEADMADSETYLKGAALERAFPERFFGLLVTLAAEILVFIMISGGENDSSSLCNHMGQRRYNLLLTFLPLLCAISGNSGLQCSTLTARGISHRHVTQDSFRRWMTAEMKTCVLLGLAMGAFLGVFAYQASDKDVKFGFVLATAQFTGVFAAGLTGSLSPLVSALFFRQDSSKWGGLMETVTQDIVSCFAMVSISYLMFVWTASGDIVPSDRCGHVTEIK